MEIQGTVHALLDEQTGNSSGGRTWRKKSFVIDVPGNYPKKVCFDIWGDNIDNFNLQVGEAVTVGFDLESREYNGKWFTNVKAWKVQKGNVATTPNTPNNPSSQNPNAAPSFPAATADSSSPMPSANDEPQNTASNNLDIEDDLPF